MVSFAPRNRWIEGERELSVRSTHNGIESLVIYNDKVKKKRNSKCSQLF